MSSRVQATFLLSALPGREGQLFTCVGSGADPEQALQDAWRTVSSRHPHRRPELIGHGPPGTLPELAVSRPRSAPSPGRGGQPAGPT